MQKIFFDHQKFSTQKFGGISRYFANIIEEIKKHKDFDYLLGVANSQNFYIKNEKQFLNNSLANYLLKSEYGYRTFKTNELYCKYLLKQNNFDVFHPTYYDPYFIKQLKKPMVTTIHDMTYERLPEYFWVQDPLTSQKRISAQRADKIIAISETTKRDLLTYLEVDERKVEVIYHGIDIDSPLALEEVKNLPNEYLFFVGDRGGYKNFYLMLDAFAILSKKHPNLNLVLSGGGKLVGADVEIINRLKLNTKVHHHQVNDAQLNYLYKNALLFIYPSLYEGFGLPILEAFRANCPILLSDTDCFLEIAQDAAAFFNRYSLEDLMLQIDELISHESLRKNLVEKGKERLKDFPIENSMKQTLELYKSLK
ncbi:glycosyltransferase family 4 protein [Pedobacter arcticus]|uniref:glycosyltransferase family 4 protein n=1 Tax=Pedobacter arcticus TaxID=752140 RepID=UPI00030FDE69|nr:glycosyltransferase family 1 protein [Pedobacter arcticus]